MVLIKKEDKKFPTYSTLEEVAFVYLCCDNRVQMGELSKLG
jgi:hypothetical protein